MSEGGTKFSKLFPNLQVLLDALIPVNCDELHLEGKTLTFINRLGVKNTLDFYSSGQSLSSAVPYTLSQVFEERRFGYQIVNAVNAAFILSKLRFLLFNFKLNSVHIIAQSALSQSGTWEDEQQILLTLTNEYLEELKAAYPKPLVDANPLVSAERDERTLKVNFSGPRGSYNLPVSHELTSRICNDIQFEADYYPWDKETRGILGDYSFALAQPNIGGLTPRLLRDTLSGKDPARRYIFPVDVIHLTQGII